MTLPTKYRLQYAGYRATPPLWTPTGVFPYPQQQLPATSAKPLPPKVDQVHRLGKRVETFVYHDLQQLPTVEWITDGLQIQQNKRTVGELDALYYDDGAPVHLEVAYKFYLYDTLTEDADPLARWIGPNRKDNLSLKLSKLRHRQFPLLRHPATAPYLHTYGLAADRIEQRVCLKGQLFVPYDRQQLQVGPLNPDCVAGFHLPFQELGRLGERQYFIPEKLDWLVVPYERVTWLDLAETRRVLEPMIARGRSPLVWWRLRDGVLGRCFLTAWQINGEATRRTNHSRSSYASADE